MGSWRERVSFTESYLRRYFVHDQRLIIGRNPSTSDVPSSLLTDLSGYYKLDEASGNDRGDSSENGFTLLETGTVGAASAKIDNGVSHDGSAANYLEVGDASTFRFADTSFQIAFWVRFDSLASSECAFSKYNAQNNNREYLVQYSSGADRIQWIVSGDGSSNSATASADTLGSPTTGVWYFISVYHDADADEIGISVNNGAFDTASLSGGVFSGSQKFRLLNFVGSGGTDANVLNGDLDEFGIWSRRLTADELTALYNSGNARTHPFTGQSLPDLPGSLDGIWSGGGPFVFPQAAAPVRIRAGGNADDTAAGDGARKVRVKGVASTGLEVEETITTAGASASAATSTSFWRINSAEVTEVGEYDGTNKGDILIENTSGDLLTAIRVGESVAQSARYAAADSDALLITEVRFTVDSAANPVRFVLYANEGFQDVSAPFAPRKLLLQLDGVDGNEVIYEPEQPFILPPGSEVWAEAATSNESGIVTGAQMSIQLAKERN